MKKKTCGWFMERTCGWFLMERTCGWYKSLWLRDFALEIRTRFCSMFRTDGHWYTCMRLWNCEMLLNYVWYLSFGWNMYIVILFCGISLLDYMCPHFSSPSSQLHILLQVHCLFLGSTLRLLFDSRSHIENSMEKVNNINNQVSYSRFKIFYSILIIVGSLFVMRVISSVEIMYMF